MGLHSEEEVTLSFPTTRHPIAIPTATLAILAPHQAGTATAAPSPVHSWQERLNYHFTSDKVETFYETNKK